MAAGEVSRRRFVGMEVDLAAQRFRCSFLMKDLNLELFPTHKSCSRSALDLPVWWVPLEPVAQWAAMVQGKRLFASGEVLILLCQT